MWITNGQFADLFTIFAKVDGDQFTAFLVERSMGVCRGDEIKLGLDGSSTTALMLDTAGADRERARHDRPGPQVASTC